MPSAALRSTTSEYVAPRGEGFGLTWLLIVAVMVTFGALTALRPSIDRLWGDEGTYLAMTASLARDGDLAFGPADREWAEVRRPGPGVTVILQRAGDRLTYSKPVLYPLLALPFYLLFGETGFFVLNGLALAAALALGWACLRRLGAPGRAALTLATFAGCAALAPYLEWRVSDAVQASLALAGTALVAGTLRSAGGGAAVRWLDRGWTAAAGGLLLGLLISMRLPNAALAAGALLAPLLAGRGRRALGAAAAVAVGLLVALAAGRELTGVANPYKAPRSGFNGVVGYPVGEDATAGLERFDAASATQSLTWRPAGDPTRAAYAALYFVAGRHTGLLAYFPAALLLALLALRRPDRATLGIGAGVLVFVVFYLAWMPWNYFGGSTFVGNRYFLAAYPLLLLAPTRLPSRRQLAAVCLVAALFGGSALVSVARARAFDPMSQSHAAAGLFRWLPYETIALEIDGQRDRYWSGDFVRFVDPWAEVGGSAFELDSELPPAELVVATSWTGSPLVLLVEAEPGAVLRVSDWGRRRWHQPAAEAGEPRGLVEAHPSPAWRRHRFWWPGDAVYRVRTLRFALEAPPGERSRATVRYLGDGRALGRSCAREVLAAAAPGWAAAGSRSRLEVRVGNRADWTWSSDDPLPVFLSYRLTPEDEGPPIEGARLRIGPVPPGDDLEADLEVDWPETPGRYLLRVDLVLEGVAWFADRTGEPLAQGWVTVEGGEPEQPPDRAEPESG